MGKDAELDPRFEAELRRGVLQLVALRFLQTPRYGYDLVRLLGAAGFPVEEGTLYPILRRFEKQGLLIATWNTEGARPRKYYVLSESGQATLDRMCTAWDGVRAATETALAEAPPTTLGEPRTTLDEPRTTLDEEEWACP